MNRTLTPGPRTGAVRIPASKSQAHRMLLCAALSHTTCRLPLRGLSDDIEATMRCLPALGAQVSETDGGLLVTPAAGSPREVCIDVGESGSTLRFLLPILGARGVTATIRMHGRLPERPLAPFDALLTAHGMTLVRSGDTLRVSGALTPGDYALPGSVSSQFVSGLLFALPLLAGASTLTVTDTLQSAQYVAMTEQAVRASGITFEKEAQIWRIPGAQRYRAPAVLTVEGDWSNAAFFLCMGALSARGVTVMGLDPDSAQGDRAILELLTRFGADVTVSQDGVTVRRNQLRGITIDAGPIPDLIPAAAVLAAFCSGETRITNAARLRLKESDRLKTTAALLTALGGHVEELPDGLTVTGQPALAGGTVDACGDHRIAMCAAVAACGCTVAVTVRGAECTAKSYPAFWDDLALFREEPV